MRAGTYVVVSFWEGNMEGRRDLVESPYVGSTSSRVLGALHKRSAASMCNDSSSSSMELAFEIPYNLEYKPWFKIHLSLLPLPGPKTLNYTDRSPAGSLRYTEIHCCDWFLFRFQNL
jgi:hypothetical protein